MQTARMVVSYTAHVLLLTTALLLSGIASGREQGVKPPLEIHSGTFVDGNPIDVSISRRQSPMLLLSRTMLLVMNKKALKMIKSNRDSSVITETTLNLIFGTVTGRTKTARPLLGTTTGTNATGRMTV